MIEAIGFTAAALTSIAFAPQVLRTWRLKRAGELSMLTLVAQTAGVSIWIVYGLSIGSAPVIASNAVTLALMLFLVVFKLRYRS